MDKLVVSKFVIGFLIDHAQQKKGFRWRFNDVKKCYERITVSFGTLSIVKADSVGKWIQKPYDNICYFKPFSVWKSICRLIGISCYGVCLWDKMDIDKFVYFKA